MKQVNTTFEKLSYIDAEDNSTWNGRIFLTFDVDWAPDYVVEYVIDILVARRIKATWFITHDSRVLEKLRCYNELFEIGIHPNFRRNSSHGNSEDAVIKYCMELAPEAKSMRTHGLLQSSNIFHQVMKESPILIDASLFIPYELNLKPFKYVYKGNTLLRVPTLWFDDYELDINNNKFKFDRLCVTSNGMKVFGFHPIHIYLNSSTRASRQSIAKLHSDLQTAPKSLVDCFRHKGSGVEGAFLDLLDNGLLNSMKE